MKQSSFRLVAALWLAGCASAVFGQEPITSNHLFNRTFLNPAFTGIDDNFRASVFHRSQWIGFDERAPSGAGVFSTYGASVEGQLPIHRLRGSKSRVCGGLTVMRDEQADNWLVSHAVKLNLSVAFTGSGDETGRNDSGTMFGFGLGTAYHNRRLDMSKLVFGDQLRPGAAPLPNSQAHDLSAVNVDYVDFDAGFFMRHSSRHLVYNFGTSVSNIRGANQSFFDGIVARVQPTYRLHTSWLFSPFQDAKGGFFNYFRTYLNPLAIYQYQDGLSQLFYGFYVMPFISKTCDNSQGWGSSANPGQIFAGAFMRTYDFFGPSTGGIGGTDAFIASVGYQPGYAFRKKKRQNDGKPRRRGKDFNSFDHWSLVASYDFPLPSDRFGSLGGGFEITLTIGRRTEQSGFPAATRSLVNDRNLLPIPKEMY